MNKKSGFSLIEFLIAMSLIGALFIVFAPRLRTNFINRRNTSYINRYCEILDNAIYKAKAENRLESIQNTTIPLLAPYIRGTLSDDSSSITMMDGTVITGGNTNYSATFPTGLTHTYIIDTENNIFCQVTAVNAAP